MLEALKGVGARWEGSGLAGLTWELSAALDTMQAKLRRGAGRDRIASALMFRGAPGPQPPKCANDPWEKPLQMVPLFVLLTRIAFPQSRSGAPGKLLGKLRKSNFDFSISKFKEHK